MGRITAWLARRQPVSHRECWEAYRALLAVPDATDAKRGSRLTVPGDPVSQARIKKYQPYVYLHYRLEQAQATDKVLLRRRLWLVKERTG